jgi:hypothetical protein
MSETFVEVIAHDALSNAVYSRPPQLANLVQEMKHNTTMVMIRKDTLIAEKSSRRLQ